MTTVEMLKLIEGYNIDPMPAFGCDVEIAKDQNCYYII